MEGQDGDREGKPEMNEIQKPSKKVRIVKTIVKAYFVGALAGSFAHIVTAAEKLGGQGVEALAAPFMIDGLAIIGMVMRSDDFSKRTNKIGFILQCVMGAFSLTMNVIAANSLYGVLFGVALVSCFVLAEWLKDQIEGREVDLRAAAELKAAKAAEEAVKIQLALEAEEAAKRAERNEKERARRAAAKVKAPVRKLRVA